MIVVNRQIRIDEGELLFEFVRSSGPGGQNVNKVATAVQLRFDVAGSPSLPDDVRRRLLALGGSRVTTEGVLVLDARRFRTQERNREDAVQRLVELVRKAAVKPKKRRPTKPTRASREARLAAKKKRGEKKRRRQRVSGED